MDDRHEMDMLFAGHLGMYASSAKCTNAKATSSVDDQTSKVEGGWDDITRNPSEPDCRSLNEGQWVDAMHIQCCSKSISPPAPVYNQTIMLQSVLVSLAATLRSSRPRRQQPEHPFSARWFEVVVALAKQRAEALHG